MLVDDRPHRALANTMKEALQSSEAVRRLYPIILLVLEVEALVLLQELLRARISCDGVTHETSSSRPSVKADRSDGAASGPERLDGGSGGQPWALVRAPPRGTKRTRAQ